MNLQPRRFHSITAMALCLSLLFGATLSPALAKPADPAKGATTLSRLNAQRSARRGAPKHKAPKPTKQKASKHSSSRHAGK